VWAPSTQVRRANSAAALPGWEEAINAGTTQLTIPLEEAERLQADGFSVQVLGVAPQQAHDPWPACYHRLDEIYAWSVAFAAEHGHLVERIDIGDSFCKIAGGCVTPGGDSIPGGDLLVMRVTNRRADGIKQGVMWIDGGLHAREIPTVELMKAAVEYLVDGYGVHPQITWLLDHFELHVGLASNPDGRQLVELGAAEPYNYGPWLWRKNANPGEDADACRWPPTGGNQYGVDLNRNHSFKWDAPGHSTNPCAATYRGQAPASEPEIEAYANYVRSLFPRQRGEADDDAADQDTTGLMINFHNATYPGTVLVPWGWTTARAPNDAELLAIGQRMASFNGYGVQYALYPVSGNTRDWGYGELGIPAYVVEVQGNDFITPCVELPRVIDQNIDAIVHALGLADRPYQRIQGPEIIDARVTGIDDRSIHILARATELRSGGDAIAAVEAVFALPGGAPVTSMPGPASAHGDGMALTPVDGQYDERSENVVLELAVAEIPPGPLLVALRSRDAGGYWGPPTIVAVEVPQPAHRIHVPSLIAP
jgi:carboxypeptidase T